MYQQGGAIKDRHRLPIGFQTFREVREENCYYVDKTAFIERLAAEGSYYFLSRPPLFGKSLLVDTMKELFEGNEPLFTGLHVHAGWNWSVRYPVVRLSFGGGDFTETDGLHANLAEQLDRLERASGVQPRSDGAPARFGHLIRSLHERSGQRVVVLVDACDRPIRDALDTPSVARANHDYLNGVYSVIKASDAHLQFAFLTGVSKFSTASVFSGLNNLIDISLERPYSSICGFTERDLDTVFAPELEGIDRERMRDWYGGYNWLGEEKVYNPFALLRLFDSREFKTHWFDTSSPAHLVDTLFERRVSSASLAEMATEDMLSPLDVDDIGTAALLFRTGCLTITAKEKLGGLPLYRLGYPNRDVRQSLNEHLLYRLLRHLAQDTQRTMANIIRLDRLLKAADCAGLQELFHAFFASIPYEWHVNNDIANYEGYYASVFYSYFAASGYDIVVEESSAAGRLDMAVRTGGHVYLFEFKVVEQAGPGAALAQLRERGYAAKYRGRGEPIHLIGVEFSRKTRTLTAFETADA